mgnify:FL=1
MKHKQIKVLFFILLLIFTYNCFSNAEVFNNDTWFLFSHGRYILENGFPTIEPFTMHENLSFVMQQWLSAVIFYLTYSFLGKIGLAALVAFIFFVSLCTIYKTCKLITEHNEYLSMIITIICAIILPVFFAGRPQIFSYLSFLLLFFFLENYIQKKDLRYLIPLPIISLLLINLHASMWGLLFCFVLPYIIEGIYFWFKKQDAYYLKPLIIVTIIMFLAGFINPYGIDAMTYVFKSYGVYGINNFVFEMMVPNITKDYGKVAYLTIFAVLLILSIKKKIKIRYFFLVLGATYLALSAWRNYPLFLIICFIPLTYSLKEAFLNIKNISLSTKQFALCVSVLILIGITFVITSPLISINKEIEVKSATNYLLKHALKNSSTIYSNQLDGGYLEYYGFKPYIDNRAEVFLKANNQEKDIFKEYYNVQKGYLLPSEFLKTYNFTYLVVSKKDIIYQEMKENNKYKLVYKDKYRYIYTPK